jgi:hypothetical protein
MPLMSRENLENRVVISSGCAAKATRQVLSSRNSWLLVDRTSSLGHDDG